MSVSDLFISKGTCYFGPGQISNATFIPCGNADLLGTQSCCYQGDYCLGSGVCWDEETIVTYVSGCTDPDYKSSKCIDHRHYEDQQWVAVARCEGDDIDLWTGCAHHPKKIAIEKENCDCNTSNPLLRNPKEGQATLDQIGSLPATAGGTISFNPTAIPTISPSSTKTPGPTSTSEPGISSPELSTGAKAGIGVGVGVGSLLIILLGFLAYKLRRRKLAAASAAAAGAGPHDDAEDGLEAHQQQQSPPPPSEQTVSPAPEYSTVWTGYKPELQANSVQKSELPGDEHRDVQHVGTEEKRASKVPELQG